MMPTEETTIARSNALHKRHEQLQRWQDSETNKESSVRVVDPSTSRVNFDEGCVFLSVCASGDKSEIKKFLARGADINTSNVDGLTALHQACIDEKSDMVEFLVEHGANVNSQDNEGWTPLHIVAISGTVDIAKILLEAGADVAAVNSEGELPVDIAEGAEMKTLMKTEIDKHGLDVDAARSVEEQLMNAHVDQWVKLGYIKEQPHAKTGATALHVAVAKGYLDVIDKLLRLGANTDARDADGWTPLHAAAHWGMKLSCDMLVKAGCNMDATNIVGQTAFDLADADTLKYLQDLKKKQSAQVILDRKRSLSQVIPSKTAKAPPPLKRRSSVTRMAVTDKKDVKKEEMLLDHKHNVEAILAEEEEQNQKEKERKLNAENRAKTGLPPISTRKSNRRGLFTIGGDSNGGGGGGEHDENAADSRYGIRRRSRHQRRSTGVVSLASDESEDENDEADGEDVFASGKGSSGRPDTSTAATTSPVYSRRTPPGSASSHDRSPPRLDSRNERGSGSERTKDYKKLYEDEKSENERLRKKMRRMEIELDEAKQKLLRLASGKDVSRERNMSDGDVKKENSLLRTKVEEMEDQMKKLEIYKQDNQRIKDENAALIRVISKLSK